MLIEIISLVLAIRVMPGQGMLQNKYEVISMSITCHLKLYIFCFCFSAILTKEISVAIATFNSEGVTGTIKFTDNPTSITITGTLYNLPTSPSLLIRMFPIDLTISPKERCNPFFLGNIYDPFPEAVKSGCSAISQNLCSVGNLTGR